MTIPAVIAFTKVALPYGWLGSMAPYPIAAYGRTWRTAEHLFQALRFRTSDGVWVLQDVVDEVDAQASPISAKMKAKARAAEMVVAPCSVGDVANMLAVVRLKLEQHPHLRKKLLETGAAVIVEDVSGRRNTGNHRFWGAALVGTEWVGENVLGKLWMKVRDEPTGAPLPPEDT